MKLSTPSEVELQDVHSVMAFPKSLDSTGQVKENIFVLFAENHFLVKRVLLFPGMNFVSWESW